MTDAANTPRTPSARAFLETIKLAVLDPHVAKMMGASGEVLLVLVSPDAIRDALIDAEAEAAAPTPATGNASKRNPVPPRINVVADTPAAPTPAEPLTSGSHEPEGLDVGRLAELAEAARMFAGYVPFSRLRVGGHEAWKRLRALLDQYDPHFYERRAAARPEAER